MIARDCLRCQVTEVPVYDGSELRCRHCHAVVDWDVQRATRLSPQHVMALGGGFMTLDGLAVTAAMAEAYTGEVYDIVEASWHFSVDMEKPSVLSQSILKFLLKLPHMESAIKNAISGTLAEANIPWGVLKANDCRRRNGPPSLKVFAPASGSAHFWVNEVLNGLGQDEALNYLRLATFDVDLAGGPLWPPL